ncbi:MAG: hypothetical protein Q9195_003818 [Heterodermia aff. obscurata]
MALVMRVKSASKNEFLSGLGLNPENPATNNLYGAMKAEAIEAFNTRLRGQRSLLRPQFKNSPPPFAANQFTDEAFKTCVRFIWSNSRNPTREWYDRAGTPGGDNWIIAWMLYHICRYRDGRNQRAQSRNFHDDDDLDMSQVPSVAPGTTAYYDPARNNYQT